MREITLDTAKGKDLLKPYLFIGLIPLPCRKVTARIPLQSPPKGGDSFPSGEAIAPAALGGLRAGRPTIQLRKLQFPILCSRRKKHSSPCPFRQEFSFRRDRISLSK